MSQGNITVSPMAIWGRVEGFDITVFRFRCRSFLEGISMAFDGYENL